MAIVKAKYVRGKSRIKAHLRYITHRRGMEGERMSRPLFGRDGPLSKLQIYDMIDATRPGVVFHKFVFNFHPVKEDTRKDLNLWEITRKNARAHQNTIWRQRAFCRHNPRRPHPASACPRVFHCSRETPKSRIRENTRLVEGCLERSAKAAPAP